MLVTGNLYGLKEAPRVWNAYLDGVLTKYGFKRSQKDEGVYYHPDSKIFVITYVDDMLVTGEDADWMNEFKVDLMKNYDLTGGDEPDKFLGITIVRNLEERTISLSMPQMILDAGIEHKIVVTGDDGKPYPVNIPGAPIPVDDLEPSDKVDDSLPYQELVGTIGYIASTVRPDLAFAFHYLSRFQSSYAQKHYDVAKKVLKYAVATRNQALVLGGVVDHDHIRLTLYTDSNWAKDIDAKSVSGVLVLMNGRPVQWRSVKQNCVAKSTFAAETYAMSTGAEEVMGIRYFLEELGFDVVSPINTFVDNAPATIVATRPGAYSDKTRALHISANYARDLHQKGDLYIQHVAGKNQKADGFTKVLGPTAFRDFSRRLNEIENS